MICNQNGNCNANALLPTFITQLIQGTTPRPPFGILSASLLCYTSVRLSTYI